MCLWPLHITDQLILCGGGLGVNILNTGGVVFGIKRVKKTL